MRLERSVDDSNPQQGSHLKLVETKPLNDETSNNEKDSSHSWRKNKVFPNKRDERKLFVGGLPNSVTTEEFHDFFEKFGAVEDSVVMFDRETRNSRGFGFVTFKDVATAHQVLGGKGRSKNTVTIQDKECEVKVSIPKSMMNGYSNSNNNGRRFHNRKTKVTSNEDESKSNFERGSGATSEELANDAAESFVQSETLPVANVHVPVPGTLPPHFNAMGVPPMYAYPPMFCNGYSDYGGLPPQWINPQISQGYYNPYLYAPPMTQEQMHFHMFPQNGNPYNIMEDAKYYYAGGFGTVPENDVSAVSNEEKDHM